MPRAHTSESFRFTVAARPSEAFALFGADRERAWAPGWNPTLLWPRPADDRAGMVFEADRAEGRATWVNTRFDPASGEVEYVYVLPGVVATRISIHLETAGQGTAVAVRYERTSLAPAADEPVRRMARDDAAAGPEWEAQIATYLRARPP
jgi:hypothetical protein